MDNELAWTPDEVRDVARYQKYLIWLIFFQIISIFLLIATGVGSKASPASKVLATFIPLAIMAARIALSVLSIYGVYKMAKALRNGMALVYAVAMLLPLIGLLALLHINSLATNVLQSNGVRVGVFGADEDDLQFLDAETITL
ncbi:MAG: hypothetical protein ABFD54_17050 [Armatimonadota bacterium]|nr:hypothetical protein [bacterium]